MLAVDPHSMRLIRVNALGNDQHERVPYPRAGRGEPTAARRVNARRTNLQLIERDISHYAASARGRASERLKWSQGP